MIYGGRREIIVNSNWAIVVPCTKCPGGTKYPGWTYSGDLRSAEGPFMHMCSKCATASKERMKFVVDFAAKNT